MSGWHRHTVDVQQRHVCGCGIGELCQLQRGPVRCIGGDEHVELQRAVPGWSVRCNVGFELGNLQRCMPGWIRLPGRVDERDGGAVRAGSVLDRGVVVVQRVCSGTVRVDGGAVVVGVQWAV